jgi:hypothetical protein
MLIHATITISGDAATLGECDARLRGLLSSQFLRGEATTHHGAGGLCYDLKVEGGIPFPAFAQASQEFPELSFAVEWVNMDTSERGSVTLVEGRASRQSIEPIPPPEGRS